MTEKHYISIQYLLLFTLLYFVVFHRIGHFPFRPWDESMFAVNAYEMEKNGNYMVPYFDGGVDWRNSKPLLLTWIQVGFIKLAGFSETTMRLPSALAVALSILMLFHFLRREVNAGYAWIAALILLTSPGYIGLHTGRTADADALLSFFLLATCLFAFRWIREEKSRFLFYAFLFFSLALMTKSFAALLIVPPILGFAIYQLRRRFLVIFGSPSFYAGILVFAIALFMVFGLREIYQPGYLDYTFSNDAGRLGKVIEDHREGWDFFLENLFYFRFSFWTVFFFAGALLAFKIPDLHLKKLALYGLLIVVIYLALVSASTTKLVWYDMPLYPILAALAALPLYQVMLRNGLLQKPGMLVLALAVVFFIPYRKAFFESQTNKMPGGDRIGEIANIFLFDRLRDPEQENMTVYHHGYKGSLLCYQYRYADRGKKLRITYANDFKSGEKVFVSHDSLKQVMAATRSVDTLMVFHNGLLLRVK